MWRKENETMFMSWHSFGDVSGRLWAQNSKKKVERASARRRKLLFDKFAIQLREAARERKTPNRH
jgi:hypothetical protein